MIDRQQIDYELQQYTTNIPSIGQYITYKKIHNIQNIGNACGNAI